MHSCALYNSQWNFLLTSRDSFFLWLMFRTPCWHQEIASFYGLCLFLLHFSFLLSAYHCNLKMRFGLLSIGWTTWFLCTICNVFSSEELLLISSVIMHEWAAVNWHVIWGFEVWSINLICQQDFLSYIFDFFLKLKVHIHLLELAWWLNWDVLIRAKLILINLV